MSTLAMSHILIYCLFFWSLSLLSCPYEQMIVMIKRWLGILILGCCFYFTAISKEGVSVGAKVIYKTSHTNMRVRNHPTFDRIGIFTAYGQTILNASSCNASPTLSLVARG